MEVEVEKNSFYLVLLWLTQLQKFFYYSNLAMKWWNIYFFPYLSVIILHFLDLYFLKSDFLEEKSFCETTCP